MRFSLRVRVDLMQQGEGAKRTRWSTFLKAHWECLTATGFLSVEVHTMKGLVTYYVLFFIKIASRSVHFAGLTAHPDIGVPNEIRTRVTAVKGRCPRPLDDGDV